MYHVTLSHDILYDILERRGGGRGDVQAAHHPGGAGPAWWRGGSDGLAGSWGSDAEDIKLPS